MVGWIIYLKLNEHSEAINSFKKAIELNNEFLSAIINLAICFQEIKDVCIGLKSSTCL